jgi:hypothetical protein
VTKLLADRESAEARIAQNSARAIGVRRRDRRLRDRPRRGPPWRRPATAPTRPCARKRG